MRYPTSRLYLILAMIASITFIFSYGQKENSEELKRGKYKVGFKSVIAFDHTQNFGYFHKPSSGKNKAPKPLVINIWYPAEVKSIDQPMLWRNYLSFSSKDTLLSKWLREYKNYNEEMIALYLFQKDKNKLSIKELNLLDSFFSTSTASIHNAKPINKKFPFVIYGQGAGGSIEDNAVFCELLASHGYVAIGSSFQRNSPDYFRPHGPEQSTRDIAFLLNYARGLSNVNPDQSGIIGHSLGAQRMLGFMSQGGNPFDAMISLETTQEYHSPYYLIWDYYVRGLLSNADEINGDVLFVTDPSAVHIVADQLNNVDRYYLTISGLLHDQFISQGTQSSYILSKLNGDAKAKMSFEDVSAKYAAICNAFVSFFDLKIKKDATKWIQYLSANKDKKFGKDLFIEHAAMKTQTNVVDLSSNKIPTPRELKFLTLNGKIDTISQILSKFWVIDSTASIFDSKVAYPLIYHLAFTNIEQGKKLYNVYLNYISRDEMIDKFMLWAGFLRLRKMSKNLEETYQIIYQLNPDQKEEIRKRIEQAESKKGL